MDELVKVGENSELDIRTSLNAIFGDDSAQQTKLAEHRAWLNTVARERPAANYPFKVGIYIRYFNQTKYENYLEYHKQKFLELFETCPNWQFIGFYIDEGSSVPNMESSPEWSRLLDDCFNERVDLIITQKVSNVSKKSFEISFCSRMLASLEKPVGIYFISEDMYTLASYYQVDMRDPDFLPEPGWRILEIDDDGISERGLLHD